MSRFLPPVVRSQSCYVDNYDLRCSTEPDGRQLYTYTVTWHDLDQFNPAAQSEDESSELPAASPQFSFMRVSAKPDMTPEDLQICKRLAPRNTPRSGTGECRCDGPCGKIKPVSEMHVMGLCDHYICQDCFENAPAVETAGNFGCPNARCYQTDLACLCTDRSRRRRKIREIISMPAHRAVSMTGNDQNDHGIAPYVMKSMPCLHLVDVRLTTFVPQRNSDRVCRQQQIVEMYDNYTISQAITVLQEYARLNSADISNRVYYCPNGHVNDRASWKRIRESDLSSPITKFFLEDQQIDIIFDCVAS